MYDLPTDPRSRGEDVERRVLDVSTTLREAVERIPLAVKLSPFYTSLRPLRPAAGAAGADGLVLFNRFYQPDIDIEDLEVVPRARLSSPGGAAAAAALARDSLGSGRLSLR